MSTKAQRQAEPLFGHASKSSQFKKDIHARRKRETSSTTSSRTPRSSSRRRHGVSFEIVVTVESKAGKRPSARRRNVVKGRVMAEVARTKHRMMLYKFEKETKRKSLFQPSNVT